MSDFPVYASSRMTYARLMLPRLLSNYNYVLYVDVDVLWIEDVWELWNIRQSIGLFGCVREPSARTVEMERRWFTENGMPFDESRYLALRA